MQPPHAPRTAAPPCSGARAVADDTCVWVRRRTICRWGLAVGSTSTCAMPARSLCSCGGAAPADRRAPSASIYIS
jgi:hypothetical protein